eukprot:g63008.t1
MESVEVKQEPSAVLDAEHVQELAQVNIHDPSAEIEATAITVETQAVPNSLETSTGQEEAKQVPVGWKQGRRCLNYKWAAAAVAAGLLLIVAVGLLVARGQGANTTAYMAPQPADMVQVANGNGNGNGNNGNGNGNNGNGNGNIGAGPGEDSDWIKKIPLGLRDKLSQLNNDNAEKFEYWVRGHWGKIPEGTKADMQGLPPAAAWKKQGDDVVKHLKQQQTDSFGPLLNILEARKNIDVQEYDAFWITNAIHMVSGPKTMQFLSKHPKVEKLEEPFSAQKLDTAWSMNFPDSASGPLAAHALGYKGAGVVIANIDDGVDGTHPALSPKYPVGGSHGTHTMGTLVGGTATEIIGVAPSAKWMACVGCGTTDCPGDALTKCAQWLLDPCARLGSSCTQFRPHISSNSWGGGRGSTSYDSYIQAWRAAGIIPVFAAGNLGPNLYTVGSPGDNCLAISVGAHDSSGTVASFSSRGPSVTGGCKKPDFSAGGVAIRSSIPNSAYASWDGTSMATPTLAGCVALMLGALPEASRYNTNNYNLIYNAIKSTTGQNGAHNNDFGYGKLRCRAAIAALLGQSTPAPTSPPTGGCTASNPSWVGDGWCDGSDYNNAACNWDGGDCCASTCTPGRTYQCGANAAFNCLAPVPCVDSPAGWYDSDGPTYNCAWYAAGSTRCTQYGGSYANFGKTAKQACCACGGGVKVWGSTQLIRLGAGSGSNPHKLKASCLCIALPVSSFTFPSNHPIMIGGSKGSLKILLLFLRLYWSQ